MFCVVFVCPGGLAVRPGLFNSTIMNVQKTFEELPELQSQFPDWRRFLLAWEKYQYKKSLWPSMRAWHKLTEAEKTRAEMTIDDYVKSTPDVKYRCHFATWLNQKRFYDEVSTDPFLKIANEIIHKNQNKKDG